MEILLYMLSFGVLNRARGSQFFSLFSSTTEGRLLSSFLMAALTVLRYTPVDGDAALMAILIDFGLIYFWSIWGWDAYWSAAIGQDPNHTRLWGVLMMTARQALILPFYAFVSWQNGWAHPFFAASFLLMGVTYYIFSKLTRMAAIQNAELANGAIMGATTWLLGI